VGWIIELSVIRFWNSTQDRGLLVEYRVFGISIGFGIHSPPVICFFLEPFKGEMILSTIYFLLLPNPLLLVSYFLA